LGLAFSGRNVCTGLAEQVSYFFTSASKRQIVAISYSISILFCRAMEKLDECADSSGDLSDTPPKR
jgi:hypothetical protein